MKVPRKTDSAQAALQALGLMAAAFTLAACTACSSSAGGAPEAAAATGNLVSSAGEAGWDFGSHYESCACTPGLCPGEAGGGAGSHLGRNAWMALYLTEGVGGEEPWYASFEGLPEPMFVTLGGWMREDASYILANKAWNGFKRPAQSSMRSIYEAALLDFAAGDAGEGSANWSGSAVDAFSALAKIVPEADMANTMADGRLLAALLGQKVEVTTVLPGWAHRPYRTGTSHVSCPGRRRPRGLQAAQNPGRRLGPHAGQRADLPYTVPGSENSRIRPTSASNSGVLSEWEAGRGAADTKYVARGGGRHD